MATFSFEPALFNKLDKEERGIIKPYKGSKKNDGTIPVTEQFYYRVVTTEFTYRTTFLRKVTSESDKIKILKRRKKPLTTEQRAALRDSKPTDWKQLVWEVEREAYRVNYIRETVDLDKIPTSPVKRGKFDWIVEDVKLVPVKGTEITTIETDPYSLHVGHLFGDRLIVKVTQLDSPVNRIISKLCRLQNGGNSCISGQLHKTVVTCHASKEPIPTPYLSDVVFALDNFPHRRNKLEEIQPLMRGDWTERTYFDAEGRYEGRELIIAAESENRGWKEFEGEYKTTNMGVSEKYKPQSLPSEYSDDDIPDSPVTIDLSDAERKLKAMGFL